MNLFSSTKLKYFIAIMEEGSVSKACQKINLSPADPAGDTDVYGRLR